MVTDTLQPPALPLASTAAGTSAAAPWQRLALGDLEWRSVAVSPPLQLLPCLAHCTAAVQQQRLLLSISQIFLSIEFHF